MFYPDRAESGMYPSPDRDHSFVNRVALSAILITTATILLGCSASDDSAHFEDGVSPEPSSAGPTYNLTEDLCDKVDWSPFERAPGVTGILFSEIQATTEITDSTDAMTCDAHDPDSATFGSFVELMLFSSADAATSGYEGYIESSVVPSLEDVADVSDENLGAATYVSSDTEDKNGTYGMHSSLYVHNGNLLIRVYMDSGSYKVPATGSTRDELQAISLEIAANVQEQCA